MTKSKSKAVAKQKYEPTERETAAIDAVCEKAEARPWAPLLKMEFDKKKRANVVNFDHDDHDDHTTAQALAMNEMGAGDPRFFEGLICQIAALGEHGQPVFETASNFALSVVRGVNGRHTVSGGGMSAHVERMKSEGIELEKISKSLGFDTG